MKPNFLIKPAFIAFLLIRSSSADSLQQCQAILLANCSGTWECLDINGHTVSNSSQAVGVTYDTCREVCGTGPGQFQWTLFSESFSSWLLPWISLISQLPYGADDRWDNLESALLTMGSPALAAYSLAITHINTRWLDKRFPDVTFAKRQDIIQVLSSLQHIPVRLTKDRELLPSLILLPENEKWWADLASRARKTRRWNTSAIMGILWVVMAFVFTIIDSFADFVGFVDTPGDAGYAVSAVWTWLLAIIIGWLVVGYPSESRELQDALREANDKAVVVTGSKGNGVLAKLIADEFAIEPARADGDFARHDEHCTAPIYNYARIFAWSENVAYTIGCYKAAARNISLHKGVNGEHWMHDRIPLRHRRGTPRQIEEYCYDESLSLTRMSNSSNAPFMAWHIVMAAILALSLQWLTTGAAVMIHMLTPPKGMGCRSLTFLIYGTMATVSFFFLLLSSITSYHSRLSAGGPTSRYNLTFLRAVAIGARLIGKVIGLLNAIALVLACVFQFTGIYDNCFCSSTVFDHHKGVRVFVAFLRPDDLLRLGTRTIWILGTIMAWGAASGYTFFIFIASPSNSR